MFIHERDQEKERERTREKEREKQREREGARERESERARERERARARESEKNRVLGAAPHHVSPFGRVGVSYLALLFPTRRGLAVARPPLREAIVARGGLLGGHRGHACNGGGPGGAEKGREAD